jgi:hypothetical protein
MNWDKRTSVRGGKQMKFKLKKCFKWTLIIAGLVAVLAWVMSDGEHHNRYRQEGINRGFQGGNWGMQPSNLHHTFHHGGFHAIGFLVAIFLWGMVIIAVVSFIRKRAAKRCSNLSVSEPVLVNHFTPLQQTSSANGDFLDEWEKNLNSVKEDNKHGNL